jgi:hypothetical protein
VPAIGCDQKNEGGIKFQLNKLVKFAKMNPFVQMAMKASFRDLPFFGLLECL